MSIPGFCELPSWIYDFRLHHAIYRIALLDSCKRETYVLPLESYSYIVYRLR